eukprot:scaffold6708_cov134-Cylindrotheca_fusiformis.AAC.21
MIRGKPEVGDKRCDGEATPGSSSSSVAAASELLRARQKVGEVEMGTGTDAAKPLKRVPVVLHGHWWSPNNCQAHSFAHIKEKKYVWTVDPRD